MGHVVAIVPDKSPTAHCKGHYSLIGCCVCPAMPPVACCQGSRGTIRQSIYCVCPATSPVSCCHGQGALVEGWSSKSALLRCSLSGETVSWPRDFHRIL
ncbi:hypothetical protein BHE74_00047043 [Ensete ventricosum]|nr:hypothetical protein BHE74_00047043 [Ensete ventricosum]